MPLKVSSQGWVKVAPPPKVERKRVVDPEEQKANLCAPLRYFACQAIDPSRERLRMLHGRAGFSSSEINLLRPVSRLEKSSTLDEWRFDTQPPRSSSRQSGDRGGSGSSGSMPNINAMENRGGGSWLGNNSKNKDEDILSWTGSIQRHDDEERRSKRRERSSRNHDNDDQSVASGSSRGSREGREKKSARAASAPIIISASPSVISEEDSKAVEEMVEVEVYPDNVSVAYSETPSERQCRHKHRHRRSHNTPTTIAEEDEGQRDTQPTPTPAFAPVSQPQPQPQPIQIPIYIPTYIPTPLPDPASIPSSIPTPTLPTAAAPSRSESYRSRQSESSYAPSTRSSSPVRSEYDPLPIPKVHKSRRAPSEASSASYASRDRVVTDPVSKHRPSAPASTSSRSSYSSYSSVTGSSVSKSSRSSHDSTPSMHDYQFQAAIFQPKSNYRGYRAPSLSKGNRWETATSALSFE